MYVYMYVCTKWIIEELPLIENVSTILSSKREGVIKALDSWEYPDPQQEAEMLRIRIAAVDVLFTYGKSVSYDPLLAASVLYIHRDGCRVSYIPQSRKTTN